MIRRQCVCSADCIHFQLDTSKIFIEPLAKVNLKRVTHHEKLIMWNRWGGITRVFQMGVSPPAAEGQVCADYKEGHVTTVVCGFSTATSSHMSQYIRYLQIQVDRQGYRPAAHTSVWVHPAVLRSLWPASLWETWSASDPPLPSQSRDEKTENERILLTL